MAKASARLNVSHPALSKQLRKLEDHYGVLLFHRSPAGVELTEAGLLLYDRLPRVLAGLQAVEEELRGFRDARKLRLGSLPSVAAHYLPPYLFAMEERGDAAELYIRPTSEELLAALRSGEIDAAVIDAPPEQPLPQLWSAELFTEPFCAVVPRSHRWAARSELAVPELQDEPLILHPPACRIRSAMTAAFGQYGLQPLIRREVPFGGFIPGYVAAGAGVAIVPELLAQHLGSELLRAVPLAEPLARRTVALAAADARTGRRLLARLQPQASAPPADALSRP